MVSCMDCSLTGSRSRGSCFVILSISLQPLLVLIHQGLAAKPLVIHLWGAYQPILASLFSWVPWKFPIPISLQSLLSQQQHPRHTCKLLSLIPFCPLTTQTPRSRQSDSFQVTIRSCHYTAPNPPWLSTELRIKPTILAKAYKALCGLETPLHRLPWWLTYQLPFAHSVPATLAFFLFFQQTKHIPTTGRLHRLLAIQSTLNISLQNSHADTLLSQGDLLFTLSEIAPHLYPLQPLLHSTSNHLTSYTVICLFTVCPAPASI